MPRFVALLRGVNVGGAKRVPMAELRALLLSLGYTDVKTLLNSGNAVFNSTGRSTAAHAGRIRTAIAATLDVEVPVIVKSAAEMAAIVSGNKLAAIVTNPSRLLVAFTPDAESLEGLAALAPLVNPPERFVLGRHALYFWCPDGIHESLAANALLGKLGRAATTRNWATVSKIASLL
jgi:uncharacterized protein (DUF1697 family)